MTERIFKAEGVVLRTRVLGEADRLVTILTLEKGKFTAVARGARKTKSRLAAGVDYFIHGRYTFHRGKTWPTITSQDTIENFSRFRDDPDLYPYGIYLAEIVDRLVSGEEACPDIFTLIIQGWKMLGKEIDRDLFCRAFELKLADIAGYTPHLQSCSDCGTENTEVFSPRQGSLLCANCRGVDSIKLEPGSIALARRLISAPLNRVNLIRSTARQREELARLTAAFYACHIDLGDIKSRRLLPS